MDGLIDPPKCRDNDKNECREIFNEDELHWQPLFDYTARERLACNHCKCRECKKESNSQTFACSGTKRGHVEGGMIPSCMTTKQKLVLLVPLLWNNNRRTTTTTTSIEPTNRPKRRMATTAATTRRRMMRRRSTMRHRRLTIGGLVARAVPRRRIVPWWPKCATTS